MCSKCKKYIKCKPGNIMVSTESLNVSIKFVLKLLVTPDKKKVFLNR